MATLCITDLDSTGILELVTGLGEPSYRAAQLEQWTYHGLARSFDEMTNLPKQFRHRLAQDCRLHTLTPVDELVDRRGTVKTLFALADGETVESTLMAYSAGKGRSRYTVCVSTQVGCPIGCPFCATGQQGFVRNLSRGEIVDQVLYFGRYLRDQGNGGRDDSTPPAGHITNVVFMGMGEPLANYDTLWKAITTLNAPEAFGLGARSMVISTAGLAPQIRRLSRERLQVGLAVSLHAADNALRTELVPVNRRYPLDQLLSACLEYVQRTGRRLTFEYVLFAGINDSLRHARLLASLLAGLDCHVNLIPANLTADSSFRAPTRDAVLAFHRELRNRRVRCTLRQARGLAIDAGCGQLRSRYAAYAPGREQLQPGDGGL